MTKAQRARCRWRRCYKAVLLCTATAGERFVVAGVPVLREKESEATALTFLNTFLDTVGSGVMKVLLVDRGFINGPEIGRLKRDHGIDTVIPIRSDMNLQEDVHGLMKRTPPEPGRNTSRSIVRRYQIRPERRIGQPPTPRRRNGSAVREQTLARQRAERVQESPPDPSRIRERTLITDSLSLTSWWDCPVPLTGVLSDSYADGHEGPLVVGHDQRGLIALGARPIRPPHRYRRAASAAEVFLGS